MSNPAATTIIRHAIPATIALSLVWVTHSFGGYHARTWGLWGLMACALAVALVGVLATRGKRLGRWASVAIAALVGLAIVAGASTRWSVYSPHEAWDEAGRILMYAATVAVGAAIVSLTGRARPLIGWIVGATAATALWTLAKMQADDRLTLFVSGRLDGPVGYSNATAALYFVGMWLAIGLAMSADRRAQVSAMRDVPAAGIEFWAPNAAGATRGGATTSQLAGWAATSVACTAAATVFAGLALLTQSRGGVIALAASVVIAVALGPMRVNLAARLGGIGIAALISRENLGAPYQDLTALNRIRGIQGNDTEALLAAQSAAESAATAVIAMGFVGLIAGVVIFAAARLSPRVLGASNLAPTILMRVACGVFIIAAIGGTLALGSSRSSSPATWVTNQLDACRATTEAPAAESAGSHFASVGTNRCDFWRVAWTTFTDNPLKGVGANNFSGPYALHRKSTELPQQAHSLPLDVLAGVGLIGGLFFAIAAGALVIPLGLMARTGWVRDPSLVGIAGAASYWIVQSTLDWLWNVPAVTIPVLLVLGAVATQVRPRDERSIADPTRSTVSLAAASVAAAGVLVVCLAVLVPLQRGDAILRQARDVELQKSNPVRSLELAAEAAQWQPIWATPVIFQSALYLTLGRPKDATKLAKIAVKREPGNWYVHYQAAQITQKSDPAFSKRSDATAKRLNPGA